MCNKVFSDIIMEVYSKLSEVDKQIEKRIKRLAFDSFKNSNDLEGYIKTMLDLIEEKDEINYLYSLITKVYNRLDGDLKMVFDNKYFNKRSIDLVKFSTRTYYRKQNKAIDYFCELLSFIGLTKENFFKNYLHLRCVKNATEKVSKKERDKIYQIFVNDNKTLEKVVA